MQGGGGEVLDTTGKELSMALCKCNIVPQEIKEEVIAYR